MIYKIFRAAEMAGLRRRGRDRRRADRPRRRLSSTSRPPAQAADTLRKHFAGEDGLWLLACDPEAMAPALRWEPSRGGALFPHLYRAAHPRRRGLGAAAGGGRRAPAGGSRVSAAERLALRAPARGSIPKPRTGWR